MRFSYQAYPVQGAGAAHVLVVHRPAVLIRVVGPAGDAVAFGLVDTGADETIFPDRFIEPLGIPIDPIVRANVVTMAGEVVVVRFGRVDLDLSRQGRSYRWSARVCFHEGARAIVGHSGFLDRFTATFNGRRRRLTLSPNGSAPVPGTDVA